MRATVARGLAWLEDQYHPEPDDWWLLTPADRPDCSADVVSRLLAAALEAASCSIIVPVHGGRRGHPVALRWRHAACVRSLPPDAGIDTYLRHLAAETRELAVTDAGILTDLDTPEDCAKYSQ